MSYQCHGCSTKTVPVYHPDNDNGAICIEHIRAQDHVCEPYGPTSPMHEDTTCIFCGRDTVDR